MFRLTKEEEQRALAIHHKSIVVDTHNDTILDLMKGPERIGVKPTPRGYKEFSLTRNLGERSDKGHIDLPRIKEGGVDCLIFAMYVSPLNRARVRRMLQMLDVFYSEMEKNSDRIALATTYQEVMDAVKEGKVSAIISIEGGEPLESDLGVLRMVYKLGVRSITLTHFPRNELGDGTRDDSGSHLTNFGIEVVEEMNRLGMIIDVSHINETGFWDVMEKTKSPVIASHSNCKALCNHHRNLTDEQIKALAKNNGVMNLSYCASFIKQEVAYISPSEASAREKVVVDDWLDHLDHVVNLVGIDHAGLGSDMDGGCGFPGMDDISKVPNITRGLVARGYSDEDIEKILGGNNLRIFREILK
jgi:membrane dipeptidase